MCLTLARTPAHFDFAAKTDRCALSPEKPLSYTGKSGLKPRQPLRVLARIPGAGSGRRRGMHPRCQHKATAWASHPIQIRPAPATPPGLIAVPPDRGEPGCLIAVSSTRPFAMCSQQTQSALLQRGAPSPARSFAPPAPAPIRIRQRRPRCA